jgi:hypothetical protein
MKQSKDLSKFTQDVIYCLERGLLEDELGQALFCNYQAGTCDEKIRHMIHQRAEKDRYRLAFSGIPFLPPKLTEGDIVLGRDQDGKPIRIPVQYLNAHTFTAASTGSGKTGKIRVCAVQILRYVNGMWLIDLRKREFRGLRRFLACFGIDLIIVPARALRINPLQVPQGVEVSDWVPRVADMLIQVLALPPRASKLIQTTLFRLYRKFGVFDGATLYPTLFDLLQAIKDDPTGNPPARAAIIDSLEPVLWSLGPKVLGYRQGWSPHDLATYRLVFEFAGLAEVDKDLILNYLLLAEFTSRVARGVSNPMMDLWISIDEGQRLCSGTAGGSDSAIGDLIGLVRGTGIGLDLSVLSTSNIASQILSNTATKILGRCGSATDYAEVGRSMGLTSEQIQWAQHHLRPGLFIAQLGEGPWRTPFVLEVPNIDFDRIPANDVSGDGLAALAALPAIPQ